MSYFPANPTENGFRLTTESDVPVSTSDRTAQSTIYLTPFKSAVIALRNSGGSWVRATTTSSSLALSSLTSDKNYDVFAYLLAGQPALELSAAWSSDTARTDAIVRQDGVWVKSADKTRRFVGTIRTTSTTTTEDSAAKAFIWNADNRVLRSRRTTTATGSWTYASGSWAAMNSGDAAFKREFIVGLKVDGFAAQVNSLIQNDASSQGQFSIGYDSTTAVLTGAETAYFFAGGSSVAAARAMTTPDIGYHYFSGIQVNRGVGTATFYGSSGVAAGLRLEGWY